MPARKAANYWYIGFVLLVAAISWQIIMDTAAHLFSGLRDWLVVFPLLVGAFYITACSRFARHRFGNASKPSRNMLWLAVRITLAVLVLLILVSWRLGAITIGFDEETLSNFGITNMPEVTILLIVAMSLGLLFYNYRQAIGAHLVRRVLEARLRRCQHMVADLEQAWQQLDLSPHLLFNTLATIRHLIREDPMAAEKAISLLSGLTKFYVKNRKKAAIPLSDELKQVKHIMALYTIRLEATVQLDIRVPDQHEQLPVMPMLLVLLVENIIRYGCATDAEHRPSLRISYHAGRIDIATENIMRDDGAPDTEGLGIGLANIRNRLATQHPCNHGFETKVVGNRFYLHAFYVAS